MHVNTPFPSVDTSPRAGELVGEVVAREGVGARVAPAAVFAMRVYAASGS